MPKRRDGTLPPTCRETLSDDIKRKVAREVASAVAERQRRYYDAHKERVAEKQRRYYHAHKERLAEYRRRYYHAHKYAENRGRKLRKPSSQQSPVAADILQHQNSSTTPTIT